MHAIASCFELEKKKNEWQSARKSLYLLVHHSVIAFMQESHLCSV